MCVWLAMPMHAVIQILVADMTGCAIMEEGKKGNILNFTLTMQSVDELWQHKTDFSLFNVKR